MVGGSEGNREVASDFQRDAEHLNFKAYIKDLRWIQILFGSLELSVSTSINYRRSHLRNVLSGLLRILRAPKNDDSGCKWIVCVLTLAAVLFLSLTHMFLRVFRLI